MLRLRLLLVATTLPFLAGHPLMADNNFAVGSCKPRLTSFATISAAVSTVPAGSTILVCPGVYAEQVTITQPLTLRGISSGNQDQAIIAVPGTNFASNVTSLFTEAVAAQVLVQTTGWVNISNLTVDGAGGDLGCAAWLAGIFFASGSSGEVSQVNAANQVDGGCGVGIWAENGNGGNQFVRVEDSSIHDMDGEGILAAGVSSPGLNVSLRDNVVAPAAGLGGILLANVSGNIAGNDVSNAMFGIVNVGPGASISSNRVSLTSAGVVLESGGNAISNRISGSTLGVWFFADGGKAQGNHITSSSAAGNGIGIEFDCHAGFASHNTINDAAVGLDQVPAGFNGSNRFANTATMITGDCAAASVAPAAAMRTMATSAASSATSIRQYRTPISPLGQIK
jgi:hypothetical protein